MKLFTLNVKEIKGWFKELFEILQWDPQSTGHEVGSEIETLTIILQVLLEL